VLKEIGLYGSCLAGIIPLLETKNSRREQFLHSQNVENSCSNFAAQAKSD